ncbi:MAG: hypothetical protein P8Y49_10140, partial [Sulfurovaceae bacterium]
PLRVVAEEAEFLIMSKESKTTLPTPLQQIAEARHHDPFAVLGRHVEAGKSLLRVFLPRAERVALADTEQPLQRIEGSDFFEIDLPKGQTDGPFRLKWADKLGKQHIAHDPYSFPPQLPDFDIHLFNEGKHRHAYRFFGAHPHTADGVEGVLFAVWAPNAARISVVGDFNQWDGRSHPMRSRGGSGVWELFIPDIGNGSLYKFEIRTPQGDITFPTAPPPLSGRRRRVRAPSTPRRRAVYPRRTVAVAAPPRRRAVAAR